VRASHLEHGTDLWVLADEAVEADPSAARVIVGDVLRVGRIVEEIVKPLAFGPLGV
jgi:hypothetical protein